MDSYNINSILVFIGFILLAIGFLLGQEETIHFQIHDTYVVLGKAQFIRILGILTILNGLVYSLFAKLNFIFNLRFKYFGIILFFLSLLIIANGLVFFSESNGNGNGVLLSLNKNGFGFLLVMSGFATLLFSLLMPLVIWISISFKNNYSK